MDQKELIMKIGRFPNVINPIQRLMSKKWECSRCGEIISFPEKHKNPAPCPECTGIFFKTVTKPIEGKQ